MLIQYCVRRGGFISNALERGYCLLVSNARSHCTGNIFSRSAAHRESDAENRLLRYVLLVRTRETNLESEKQKAHTRSPCLESREMSTHTLTHTAASHGLLAVQPGQRLVSN